MQNLYNSGAMMFPSEMTVFIEEMLETPRAFFICSALLYAMSLCGIVQMWNVNKAGFHMYTLAQLLLLLVTVLFLGRERLALGDVMLTLLFVVYYFIAMRQLDALKQQADAEAQTGAENETGGPADNGEENM